MDEIIFPHSKISEAHEKEQVLICTAKENKATGDPALYDQLK
jgi:hypothetical protein